MQPSHQPHCKECIRVFFTETCRGWGETAIRHSLCHLVPEVEIYTCSRTCVPRMLSILKSLSLNQHAIAICLSVTEAPHHNHTFSSFGVWVWVLKFQETKLICFTITHAVLLQVHLIRTKFCKIIQFKTFSTFMLMHHVSSTPTLNVRRQAGMQQGLPDLALRVPLLLLAFQEGHRY